MTPKKAKKICASIAASVAVCFAASCGQSSKKTIYVAWSNKQDSYSFVSTLKTIEAIGCQPVVLDMIHSSDLSYRADNTLVAAVDEHGILLSDLAGKVKTNLWKHSDVEKIAQHIDCIIFPGGSDICPTLWKEEGQWHGIEGDTEYSAERDVSDYLLMSYCLEKNIPMFAICRGMQMLSIVSGARMINDIPTYFASLGKDDHDMHRDHEKKVFAAHDVQVTDKSSLLYKITNTETLTKVPSWHHQGVFSVDNTPLTVTAENVTDGVTMIEAVERKDLSFCLGVQFHPEVAVRKSVDQEADAANYMDLASASSFFKTLANYR